MASRKTPPKNLRDRITAKVAATVLWPVAKARPESDWARMQKRLSTLGEGDGDKRGGGDGGAEVGGSQNPFIRAVEEAEREAEGAKAKAAGPGGDELERAPEESPPEGDSPRAASAPPASDDLGAWPPGPTAGAPAGGAEASAPPTSSSGRAAGGVEKTGEPGVSHDEGDAPTGEDEETEFATWAREHGGSRELPAVRRVRSLLFQRGVKPPMALFALLLSVAAAAWLYDYWRRPREPQPASVSSSVVRGAGAGR